MNCHSRGSILAPIMIVIEKNRDAFLRKARENDDRKRCAMGAAMVRNNLDMTGINAALDRIEGKHEIYPGDRE